MKRKEEGREREEGKGERGGEGGREEKERGEKEERKKKKERRKGRLYYPSLPFQSFRFPSSTLPHLYKPLVSMTSQ